jgi:hypothetical protein
LNIKLLLVRLVAKREIHVSKSVTFSVSKWSFLETFLATIYFLKDCGRMGGGDSAPVLESSVLVPLDTYSVISDTDEYWAFLFSHIIQPEIHSLLRTRLHEIHEHYPQNVRQLYHISAVTLIDLMHRLSLTRDLSLKGRLNTVVTLLHVCLVVLMSYPDCSSFVRSCFDDCGVLRDSIITNMIKALYLPGITLVPDHEHWSGGMADIGQFDELRILIVEDLILWKILQIDFLDFSQRLCALSSINTMRFAHLLGEQDVRSLALRCRLAEASLLLMFWTGTYITHMEIAEEEYEMGFVPLNVPLVGPRSVDEVETFFVPLAIHYFFGMTTEYIEATGSGLVKNLIVAADWLRGREKGKGCLDLLARVCQISRCDAYLSLPTPGFVSDIPVHPASQGAVLVEVAVRVGVELKSTKVCRALALVLAMRIPKTPDIANRVWLSIFKLLDEKFDDDSQKLTVRAIHWSLSRNLAGRTELGAAVIRHAGLLHRIYLRDQTFVEVREILGWVQAQTAKLNEIQGTFTNEQFIEALSDPANVVEPYQVGENPPPVPFDIKNHYWEIFWILSSSYLARYCELLLPDYYIADNTDSSQH